VMWDNRCTMHRGTDYDDLRWVRDMRRTTVSDIANTLEQEGIPLPAASGQTPDARRQTVAERH
jgi:alpha-ketoglutarate-dependent 2,4-dichlorophenoxyacetate dioxygenase